MPISSTGKRAHIVLNVLGVPNRLNPAQLYETELNFLADNISEDMKKKSLNDAKKFFFGYLKDVSPVQYESTKNFFDRLTKEEKKQYLKEVMEHSFPTYQPPFWDNVNFDKLAYLYDKYKYEPYDVYIEGVKCEHKMIIADIYMIRLKHEPSGKLSARSTSYVNMKNAPSKSLSYKKHEEPFSKTPIRLGEMELINLLLSKNSKIQSKFNSFYANNELNRRELNKKLLTEDILHLDSIDSVEDNNGNNTLLNVLFKTLSIELKPIRKKKKKS